MSCVMNGGRRFSKIKAQDKQVQTTFLPLWPLLAQSSFIPWVEISGPQVTGWSPGPDHASHLHPTQGQAGELEALGQGAELSPPGYQVLGPPWGAEGGAGIQCLTHLLL